MTGDELISSGAAYLDGFSVSDHIKEVQQRLGYCPQFDALIEQMTVTEHLYMYARLRGVAEHQIQDIADDLMDTLLLKDHAHKNAKDLRWVHNNVYEGRHIIYHYSVIKKRCIKTYNSFMA